MPSHIAHRLALCGDRDVLHAAAVTVPTCVLSVGLAYVGYFVHVLRVAYNAPCVPERGECVLLFGKHAPDGRLDRDFEARRYRAVSLWRSSAPAGLVLLGGGAPDEPSEAEVARRGLYARAGRRHASVAGCQVTRHHAEPAQCARPAGCRPVRRRCAPARDPAQQPLPPRTLRVVRPQFGFDARLTLGPRMLGRIAREAACVCLTDVGGRWARLIRHQRMLARIS